MSTNRRLTFILLFFIVISMTSLTSAFDVNCVNVAIERTIQSESGPEWVNIIDNPSFDTGAFSPWVNLGDTAYNVIQSTQTYSGGYALFLDSHLSSAPYEPVYQEINTDITLFETQKFSAAIYPFAVGNTAGQAGVDLIEVHIRNLTSDTSKVVNYEWSGYTFPGNDLGVNISRVFYLLFDLIPNEWNVIERNLYEDYTGFYGTPENISELVVNKISILSHNSNGDPGDFYIDDLYIGQSDWTDPVLNSPDDIIMNVGDDANITWIATDQNPGTYVIQRNGTEYASGLWNTTGEEIIVNLESEEVGVHVFQIFVFDSYNNHETNSVVVTILPPEFSIDITTIIIIVSGVTIVVVVILIIRNKN